MHSGRKAPATAIRDGAITGLRSTRCRRLPMSVAVALCAKAGTKRPPQPILVRGRNGASFRWVDAPRTATQGGRPNRGTTLALLGDADISSEADMKQPIKIILEGRSSHCERVTGRSPEPWVYRRGDELRRVGFDSLYPLQQRHGNSLGAKADCNPVLSGSIPAHASNTGQRMSFLFRPLYDKPLWGCGHLFRMGQAVAKWIAKKERGAFLAGIRHEILFWRRPDPEPDLKRARRLMLDKHNELIKALSKADRLQEQNIALSVELSALKRARPSRGSQTDD